MSENQSLKRVFLQVWQQLQFGLADRAHPARFPTFATIGSTGPEMRTLVLRGVDADAMEVELHTDRASAKVGELCIDPRAALHIWLPTLQLQIRMRATVAMIHADPARWAAIPDAARRGYGATPSPGVEIASPEEHVITPDMARHTALRCVLNEIETLQLDKSAHRRAIFQRVDGWQGRWCAP